MGSQEKSPLGQFLKDNKSLLYNLDLLGLADNFLLLDDNSGVARAIEVVCTIEVVKVAQGLDAVPVIERIIGT
jgi:hypothetical protein